MVIAQAALEQFTRRGLRVEIRQGVFYIGPGRLLDDELREMVKENMAGLVAILAADTADLQWRVATMIEKLLPLEWPCPVPVLHVKDFEPGRNLCASCGELLDVGEGDSYTCGACASAKTIALDLWMQRPAQIERAA
jgi:hypothetical protein